MSRGTFEYYVIDIQTEDLNHLETQLNTLGNDGWKLQHVIDEGNTYIFERPKLDLKPYTGRFKDRSENVTDQPRPKYLSTAPSI